MAEGLSWAVPCYSTLRFGRQYTAKGCCHDSLRPVAYIQLAGYCRHEACTSVLAARARGKFLCITEPTQTNAHESRRNRGWWCVWGGGNEVRRHCFPTVGPGPLGRRRFLLVDVFRTIACFGLGSANTFVTAEDLHWSFIQFVYAESGFSWGP